MVSDPDIITSLLMNHDSAFFFVCEVTSDDRHVHPDFSSESISGKLLSCFGKVSRKPGTDTRKQGIMYVSFSFQRSSHPMNFILPFPYQAP